MKVIEDTLINNERTFVTVEDISTLDEGKVVIKSLALLTMIELSKLPFDTLLKYQISICEEYVSVDYPNGDWLEYYIE